MPSAGGGQNERLARIEEKVDAVLDRLVRLDACQGDHERRLSGVEQVSAGRTHQIEAIRSDVERLEKKSETWSVINSLGALAAALLGGMGLFPK